MARIPSAAEIAAKWTRVTPGRQADYDTGVKDPSVDWQRGASSAAESYATGVQEAIARGGFARGVEAAGNEHWRAKTTEIGIARWGQGVRAAQADMERGVEPIVAAVERLTLPPRRPRGDPQNIERVAVIARALSEVRRRR